MSAKIKQVKLLVDGQEVAIAGCRETGRVVRRIGKNQYVVRWNGYDLTLSRNQLGVNVHGRWMTGPHNATS